MNKPVSVGRGIALLGIPLAMIFTILGITKLPLFNNMPSTLGLGITVDLLLIIPFTYFLLIRKTNIPKSTVVPVLILGIILGSVILPAENQSYLTLFKFWALPIIEIGIISFLVYNVHKAIILYKQEGSQSADFFSALKNVANKLLPKVAVFPVITEISIIYYGFINWQKKILDENEFSYHKNSGTNSILITLMFLIVVETFVFHVLLSQWSDTAAYILTGISMYTFLQIFGILRSLPKRPIIIGKNELILRFGILSEAVIPFSDINSIELSSADIELTKNIRKLSPLDNLDSHNTIIKLNKMNSMAGFYGVTKTFDTLVLFVDKNEVFERQLKEAIEGNS